METIYRDYAAKGVQFYYIYKALAHPELDGYVQPFTLEERLMHVKEAERTLGSEIPWISDTMGNDLKHALGDSPNSEFVVDPEGNFVVTRTWSSPQQLRRDLENLIGPVENPTQVSDLKMKFEPPPEIAASGVVPRVNVPGRMHAVKVEPKESFQPFYMKLRAEADEALLGNGDGTLYVGFHVDPLYHVHWNNLVGPVKYQVTAPQGTTVSPSQGEGPKVEVASDVDPREFLMNVKISEESQDPLHLAVHYFACNDEEGWCIPVSQEYDLYLQPDRDGGWNVLRGRPNWRTFRLRER
ncbi:MAG: hypothetical protein V3R94_01090 [Acidobacteriota bacterium]